jgi:hypothetical protein
MDGLRLFEKCEEAGRNFSKHDAVHVLVICGNGSAFLYIDGRQREIPWVLDATFHRPPEAQATYRELTPLQAQFGKWDDETGKFTVTRKMTVDEFLNLALLTKRSASAR